MPEETKPPYTPSYSVTPADQLRYHVQAAARLIESAVLELRVVNRIGLTEPFGGPDCRIDQDTFRVLASCREIARSVGELVQHQVEKLGPPSVPSTEVERLERAKARVERRFVDPTVESVIGGES